MTTKHPRARGIKEVITCRVCSWRGAQKRILPVVAKLPGVKCTRSMLFMFWIGVSTTLDSVSE